MSSLRLVTDQESSVISRRDYLLFGEEIQNNVAGRTSQFGAATTPASGSTGKETSQMAV